MTVLEMKNEVMFQTNNDTDDVGDFLPYLLDYINEGYDRMVMAYAGVHVPCTDYTKLSSDADTPLTPAWTHRFLADYATWLVYRNGNAYKQSRGQQFLAAFERCLSMIRGEGGENADGIDLKHFINIPD